MDTLAEDECLAKTSDGVRRFKLPAEHHFIALYRSVFNEAAVAGDALVQVFLNRRQYDKAREALEQTIAKHGPGSGDSRKTLLKQITGNWGRFEVAETVPAGVKPKLPLVFRNAANIKLTAAPVDMEAVLRDTMDYLKSNPRELEWQRLNPSLIANQLIAGKGEKCIGKITANWESKLTPREKHRDTRADIEVPLDQAGAWWISGEMEGGNSFHTLVWIVDSVLVQRDVGGAKQWWVADAAGGAPVAEAGIEFFGYRMIHLDRKNPLERNMDIRTKDFGRTTDADGKSLLKPGEWDTDYQWLAIARKKGRAPAFFGFQPYGIQEPQLTNGNRDITYGISDRPLYKPGDTAHLKFYLRNVGYFQPDEAKWSNKTGRMVISNGRGEEVMKIEGLKTDALGAVESDVVIPKDAVLGDWTASYWIGGEIAATV
ncbi:MAG TPA: MG2 domain-containing protein, partial [Luteolibacter sp.]